MRGVNILCKVNLYLQKKVHIFLSTRWLSSQVAVYPFIFEKKNQQMDCNAMLNAIYLLKSF